MLPRIKKLFLEKPGQVLFYLDAALKACVLNLDNGIELLHACYSKHFGRPADFDPADMLRSLLLMVSLKITSVPKWANDLAKSDILAILSGFEPGKTPSPSASHIAMATTCRTFVHFYYKPFSFKRKVLSSINACYTVHYTIL
jgi:hypothetical protein